MWSLLGKVKTRQRFVAEYDQGRRWAIVLFQVDISVMFTQRVSILPTNSFSTPARILQGMWSLPSLCMPLIPTRDLASPLFSRPPNLSAVGFQWQFCLWHSILCSPTDATLPSHALELEYVSKLTRIACTPSQPSLYIIDVSIFLHHTKGADPIWLNYHRSSVNSR